MKIGILTSGGDCPGINATIRGVCKTAINHYGMEVFGIRSGFRGLLDNDIEPLTEKSLSGLLNLGGTILGTSREKPFKKRLSAASEDKPALMLKNIHELGLDCIVCIDRLHSTASSHQRVMVIEVMGHKAGWIALYSGMAGGGDVILIPELPYNIHNIGNTIIERLKKGKPYSIVVVAEGIQTINGKKAAEYIAEEIEYETGFETRETVLGYIQRNLATRMGGHATELIASGQFGRMVSLQGAQIGSVSLNEVAGKLKLVDENHDLIVQGKRMGICFG